MPYPYGINFYMWCKMGLFCIFPLNWMNYYLCYLWILLILGSVAEDSHFLTGIPTPFFCINAIWFFNLIKQVMPHSSSLFILSSLFSGRVYIFPCKLYLVTLLKCMIRIVIGFALNVCVQNISTFGIKKRELEGSHRRRRRGGEPIPLERVWQLRVSFSCHTWLCARLWALWFVPTCSLNDRSDSRTWGQPPLKVEWLVCFHLNREPIAEVLGSCARGALWYFTYVCKNQPSPG